MLTFSVVFVTDLTIVLNLTSSELIRAGLFINKCSIFEHIFTYSVFVESNVTGSKAASGLFRVFANLFCIGISFVTGWIEIKSDTFCIRSFHFEYRRLYRFDKRAYLRSIDEDNSKLNSEW